METSFGQYSDPFESYLESYLGGHANSAASDVVSAHRKSHSDEDLILATNRPKKRAGRKKFRETRHPVYRGVRRRNSNRWVCEVREPNKQNRVWLGTYPTPEMAARAHDVAALAFRGPKACLNFADSSWRLPVPVSNEAKDIQKAAAEAAEGFRPREFDDGGSENFDQAPTTDEMMKVTSDEEASTNLNNAGNVFYTDEEMIFGMPGLLTSMAEGLLLSPPSYLSGDFDWDDDDDNMHGDVSLWNHSV